jgi:hypothetical protein
MSRASCCCGPQTPLGDGDRRYSSSCCCEKCPSVGAYYMCFDQDPVHTPSATPGSPGCTGGGPFREILGPSTGDCPGPLHGPLWLSRQHVNCCTYKGPSIVDGSVGGSWWGTHPCWDGSVQITLELEELCMSRNAGNVGFLKRGLEEDVSCAGGWPTCSPCYVGNEIEHLLPGGWGGSRGECCRVNFWSPIHGGVRR